MALRLVDNQDTYDALFQLYQRDSLSLETILDLLDIDHDAYKELVEGHESGLAARVAATLGIEYQEPKCRRCGGTGNIGVISMYRCPEC